MQNKDELKVDLHVHSPASIDFLGDRSAKGYATLIKAFSDEQVNVIALTDHNTVNGYLEYSKHAAMARELYKLMIQRGGDSVLVQDLKKEVECLDRVKVFPGVEISVYPSLHIILVFDPGIIDEVSEFLRKSVGLGAAVDTGNPEVYSKFSAVSVLDLATEKFQDRFFCLLPHVESSKGAWSELQGSCRADLLKDERVIAAQFSNPDTPDIIRRAMANRTYKRKSPLTFFQSSDYHGAPNVRPASQYSVLTGKDEVDFDGLRSMICDSTSIQCSFQRVESEMAEFIDGRKTISFDFTNELPSDPEMTRSLTRALCATLNSENTLLRFNLFNVNKTAEKGAEVIAKMVEDLGLKLDPPAKFSFKVAGFSASVSRQRYIVEIDSNSKLRIFDDTPWIVSESAAVAAKAWQIEEMVLRGYYRVFGKDKQEELEAASTDIIRIANGFPAMALACRLERFLSKLRFGCFKLNFERPEYPKVVRVESNRGNGVVCGNCIVLRHDLNLKGGRLATQRDYYRFSAPEYKIAESGDLGGLKIPPKSLIIFPEGGVNVCLNEKKVFAPFPIWTATIPAESQFDEDMVEDMLLGTSAWLKSSFVLWFISSFYQTDDLFEVMLSSQKIPLAEDFKFLRKLGVYGRNVLNAEAAMLTALEKIRDTESADKWGPFIEKHNKSVATNMRLIDQQNFSTFGILKRRNPRSFQIVTHFGFVRL